MNTLDGNAIAGTLYSVFGEEMTAATGTCAGCGTTGHLAELTVYLKGPGVVARCPHCAHLLVVIVQIRGLACVDLSGLAALERPG